MEPCKASLRKRPGASFTYGDSGRELALSLGCVDHGFDKRFLGADVMQVDFCFRVQFGCGYEPAYLTSSTVFASARSYEWCSMQRLAATSLSRLLAISAGFASAASGIYVPRSGVDQLPLSPPSAQAFSCGWRLLRSRTALLGETRAHADPGFWKIRASSTLEAAGIAYKHKTQKQVPRSQLCLQSICSQLIFGRGGGTCARVG
eukprot:2622957-Amphidinium_carterae.2